MFRPLLRTTTTTTTPARQFVPRPLVRTRPRAYTSKLPTSHTTTPSLSPPSPASPRLRRLLSRTPTFLHRHVLALSTAPVSHITSFLLLHEITAIIPLLSLAALFHYTHWLPAWFSEGAWVLSGVEKFGRYFQRKGWIGEEERREAGREVVEMQHARADEAGGEVHGPDGNEGKNGSAMRDTAWNIGEGGVRIVVEFATAYAITKALLVPRIMFSVWATPAFARWTVVPVMAKVGRMFGKSKKKRRRSGETLPGSGDGKGH